MVSLTLRKVKKGEVVYGGCIAEDDELRVVTDGNITGWFYSYDDFLLLWWVWADSPGSKSFLPYLRQIEETCEKPVWVVQPMLARLYDFFYKNDFKMVSVKPDIAIRRPVKPPIESIGKVDTTVLLPDDFFYFVRHIFMQKKMEAKDISDEKHEVHFTENDIVEMRRLARTHPELFQKTV